jgi:NAD(P)-dependent dehydrogenase (short-subunit alcohol dehydrogenase family)
MTAPQTPLGSPFGMKSTAAEVIAGRNLAGKVAIVTGGHSGIGIETTRALALAGAEVLVPARDPDRARAALNGVAGKISVAPMDLADLASVRKFASETKASKRALHLLINNAGIMACPQTRTKEGWELQFATNHLGHFVLTREIESLLKAANGARVVALSSIAHRRSGILWNDTNFETSPYDKWVAYGQSKTANALFARHLDARLKGDGVRAFSAHPGGIMTPLQRHLQKEEMIAMGWIDEQGEISAIAKSFFKTPEQGAATTVWCATNALLDDKGGVYCENCDIAAPADESTKSWKGVHDHATNDAFAERLWTQTERILA